MGLLLGDHRQSSGARGSGHRPARTVVRAGRRGRERQRAAALAAVEPARVRWRRRGSGRRRRTTSRRNSSSSTSSSAASRRWLRRVAPDGRAVRQRQRRRTPEAWRARPRRWRRRVSGRTDRRPAARTGAGPAVGGPARRLVDQRARTGRRCRRPRCRAAGRLPRHADAGLPTGRTGRPRHRPRPGGAGRRGGPARPVRLAQPRRAVRDGAERP